MQRLNIPLNSKAMRTRRPRRVLWISVILLIFFFFVWEISVIILSRDTVTKILPVNTEISLRIQPNSKNSESIISLLQNIPLISNRNLTVIDILSFTKGEFAILFLSDGSRALILRTNEESLPKDLLETLGIVWKKAQPSIFILSEKELSLIETPQNKSWSFQLPLSKKLGTIRILNQKETLRGDIISRGKDRIDINLPKLGLPTLPQNLPNFRAIIALPIVEIGSKLLNPSINSVLSDLEAPSEKDLTTLFKESKGYLLLPKTEKRSKFLLSISNSSLELADFKQLLRTASALAHPEIRYLSLLDESWAQEIIADPEKISLEETNISGLETYRVPMLSNEYLMLSTRDGNFVLTNDEDSLRFWANPELSSQAKIDPGTVAWINESELRDLADDEYQFYNQNILEEFWNNFPIISISETNRATVIKLSR